jgi:hypothetical protein
MTYSCDFRGALPFLLKRRCVRLWIALAAAALTHGPALAQAVDCARLPAEIAALDQARPARPNRYTGAIQKQRAELDRTISSARSLGCDRPQIPIFGQPLPARCPGLNAQIQQMQASLGQLQAAAGQSDPAAARQDLIARYNAYCRGSVQAAAQPQQRGFFEQLFGGALLPNQPPMPIPAPLDPAEEDHTPRGGSQAVCVRSCDGGFFPLNYSARRDPDQLTNLCQALCPNASVSVYSRAPFSEISTAVSLDDGSAYSDLPNALKFQKSFEPSCTCKPPGQSWAQALSGAERLIGQDRRGDIMVTEEKSVELSAPKADNKKPARSGVEPAPAAASEASNPGATSKPGKTSSGGAAPLQGPDQFQDIIGPDGVKRRVRIVGPTL